MFSIYYIEHSGGSHEVATNVLVSFSLVVFAGIMVYHILVFRLKLKWESIKNWIEKIMKIRQETQSENPMAVNQLNNNNEVSKAVETVSFAAVREELV